MDKCPSDIIETDPLAVYFYRLNKKIGSGNFQRHAPKSGFLFYPDKCIPGCTDYPGSFFQYACFFKCDFFDGPTELASMVQFNICNYSEQFVRNIGCIQPSAHAYFHYCKINIVVGKIPVGHCRKGLELSHIVSLLKQGNHFFFITGKTGFCYLLSINPDSLAIVDKMGGKKRT